MRILRHVGILLLFIIILIGVSGCMSKPGETGKTNRAEKIKDEALEYLNKNYSDDFSPVRFESKSWADENDTMTFTSKKYDGQYLYVYVKKDNGKYTFSDDYFRLYMSEEADEYFKNLADSILGDVITKVDFNNFTLPSKLNPKSTFTDYLESGEVLLDLYIFGDNISTATSESQYKELLNELIEKRLDISVYFIAINADDKGALKSTPLRDILSSTKKLFIERKGYIIKGDFSVEEYPLREYSPGGES